MSVFLTCNTKDRYPYFKEKGLCDLWIEGLKICKELKKFDLYAFCLNQDHFHLLLWPDEEVANISEIMRSLKTNYSRNANCILGYTKPNVSEVTGPRPHVMGSYLQEKQKEHFEDMACTKIIHHSLPKFQRQKSFHDHIIRNEKDYKEHFNYTRYNYIHHEDMPKYWSYHSGNEEYADLLDTLFV